MEVLRVAGVRLEVWSDAAVGPSGGTLDIALDTGSPSDADSAGTAR